MTDQLVPLTPEARSNIQTFLTEHPFTPGLSVGAYAPAYQIVMDTVGAQLSGGQKFWLGQAIGINSGSSVSSTFIRSQTLIGRYRAGMPTSNAIIQDGSNYIAYRVHQRVLTR
jgi:hypothetical protein